MMLDSVFDTLVAKTFVLLAGALLICLLGAFGIVEYFRRAAMRGASYVTIGKSASGEIDLTPEPGLVKTLFWPALILNFAAYMFLVATDAVTPRLLAFAIAAFTEGWTIGLVLLTIDERLGLRVLGLTSLATLAAGSIGYFGNLDVNWIGSYLFVALFTLLIITSVRLVVKISGRERRLIAGFGVLVFTGYLLYDFSALRAARGAEAINNWSTALDFAVNIFLDIINLFLQILDAVTED